MIIPPGINTHAIGTIGDTTPFPGYFTTISGTGTLTLNTADFQHVDVNGGFSVFNIRFNGSTAFEISLNGTLIAGQQCVFYNAQSLDANLARIGVGNSQANGIGNAGAANSVSVVTNSLDRLIANTVTVSSTLPIKLPSYLVSTLPSASAAGAGALAFVTDYASTAILGLGLNVATAGGSGSGKVIVYSDGTSWIVL